MARLGAASLAPGRSGHETALRCWASNDVKTITQRHRVRALRSRQTGAPSTRRCAPVGWSCCAAHGPSLSCCLPLALPSVAWWAALSPSKRHSHSPKKAKPRRAAQLAARAACELVRSQRKPSGHHSPAGTHRLQGGPRVRPHSGRAAALLCGSAPQISPEREARAG